MRHLLIKIWKNWFKNIRCDWDIHWLKNMNWLLWPDLNWIFQYLSLIKRIAKRTSWSMDCLSISHASLHGTLISFNGSFMKQNYFYQTFSWVTLTYTHIFTRFCLNIYASQHVNPSAYFVRQDTYIPAFLTLR